MCYHAPKDDLGIQLRHAKHDDIVVCDRCALALTSPTVREARAMLSKELAQKMWSALPWRENDNGNFILINAKGLRLTVFNAKPPYRGWQAAWGAPTHYGQACATPHEALAAALPRVLAG